MKLTPTSLRIIGSVLLLVGYFILLYVDVKLGWYMEYIYPYDDPYNITISPERKLRIDQRPPVVYVSQEAYDALVEAINKPPEYNEKIARVLNRKSPWEG